MNGNGHYLNQTEYLSIEMVKYLGRATGRRFDTEQIRQDLDALGSENRNDPMAHLALVVDKIGLKLTPVEMSLREALWKSNEDTPVIFWSEEDQGFLIANQAGAFKTRVISYNGEEGKSESLSRSK